ncbi:MAG: hypothetical protein IPN90_03620 [Elusimicrobia bacterium]|nr:hypothetical protein [Elusimicrobiota bacterium]
MIDHPIRAEFDRFDLPGLPSQPAVVVLPTVRGTRFSRYGTHAYYFLNLKTQKGLCVRIRHRDIVMPGLGRLAEAVDGRGRMFPRLRLLFKSYHYGFNFLEQIMLMTVPHTVTEMGHGRFIVNLWSYFGHLLIDLRAGTVTYRMTDGDERLHVFGSNQWRDAETESLYYMTYSLTDSMKKASNPRERVFSRIMKKDAATGETRVIWEGYFADYMHDILISRDKQYMVACELGRFLTKRKPHSIQSVDPGFTNETRLDRFRRAKRRPCSIRPRRDRHRLFLQPQFSVRPHPLSRAL